MKINFTHPLLVALVLLHTVSTVNVSNNSHSTTIPKLKKISGNLAHGRTTILETQMPQTLPHNATATNSTNWEHKIHNVIDTIKEKSRDIYTGTSTFIRAALETKSSSKSVGTILALIFFALVTVIFLCFLSQYMNDVARQNKVRLNEIQRSTKKKRLQIFEELINEEAKLHEEVVPISEDPYPQVKSFV